MSDEIMAPSADAPAPPQATLELPDGRRLETRLLKLMPAGAMIESCRVPETGTHCVFVHGAIRVTARVSWAGLRRAGLAFDRAVEVTS